jgi:ABC-2 type transport system permease protein
VPIHDQGYRRYTGHRHSHGRVWWVIARTGLRARLAERRFLALLLLAWVLFLVRAVQLYAAANLPQAAALLAPSPQLFRDFLVTQGLFAFFVAIYAGAGLIAHDRRANALPIYLSRPLSVADYVAGKFAILVVLLVAVTWVPAVLLLVLQALFAGDLAFLREYPFLVPAMTAFAALQILLWAPAILALSALSTSARFVGMLFAGVVFFSGALAQMIRLITGSRGWAWLSPRETLGALADALFRLPGTPAVPVETALLVVGVVTVTSVVVLAKRVRAVEVIG